MDRRTFLTTAALLSRLSPHPGGSDAFAGQQAATRVSSSARLDQGPFDVDQDQGWLTLLFTTPSERPQRNPGLGLVGYTWEESGPSLAARAGRETLAQQLEKN